MSDKHHCFKCYQHMARMGDAKVDIKKLCAAIERNPDSVKSREAKLDLLALRAKLSAEQAALNEHLAELSSL